MQKGTPIGEPKVSVERTRRMQLTAFRIFKYRNIKDSGLIKLADHLTCIVGKNQSGKTNLLRTAATISESRLPVNTATV
jgi:predicted ATP-dependent endonuclease of OLD family